MYANLAFHTCDATIYIRCNKFQANGMIKEMFRTPIDEHESRNNSHRPRPPRMTTLVAQDEEVVMRI